MRSSSLQREIPPEINWVLRVDGHTDNLPLSGTGRYRDNWELSSARATSVVKFLIANGVPANRLVAAGFGEFQPLDAGRHRRGAQPQPPHRAEADRALIFEPARQRANGLVEKSGGTRCL